jgi:hypothetical protein
VANYRSNGRDCDTCRNRVVGAPYRPTYFYNIFIFSREIVTESGYSRRGPGFDYRRYQIYCAAVCLKQGTLSLVRINEELLE